MMAYDENTIQGLINNPTESLAVELKTWFDPASVEGVAKLAKACIALRNNDGGFLLIGFDNKSCQPDPNRPPNIRDTFHADKVQDIVSKYSSEKFEALVKFVTRDNVEFPVICISGGLRTPVAAKCELKDSNGKTLSKEHAVYVRSLNANGRVSTTEVKHGDWDVLVSSCMNNREADVGRFLRRHLASADIAKLRDLFQSFVLGDGNPTAPPPPRPPETHRSQLVLLPTPPKQNWLKVLLDEGATRFAQAVQNRKLTIPEHGTFEAGFVIDGNFPPQSATERFMNLIASSNPHLTGWPFWLDSRGFREATAHPYVFNGNWEALILTPKHLDFWAIDPNGRFYHRRILDDDAALLAVPDAPQQFRPPDPMTVLDFGLPLWRVGEVLALGLIFARALGASPDNTILRFCFRWTRLNGRELTSWTDPYRDIMSGGPSHQDTVLTEVDLPTETSDTALFQYIHAATRPLFEVFGGYELSPQRVEEIVSKMFKRTG